MFRVGKAHRIIAALNLRRHHEPLPRPDLADLPEDIRAKVLEVQEKAGFVPTVFLALARRPASGAPFCVPRRPDAQGGSGLSKGDREMIVTTTSAANTACTAWWRTAPSCAFTRKNRWWPTKVAVNYRKATSRRASAPC